MGLLWFLDAEDGSSGERIVGANHSGYLGQYLVLDLVNRVVAVRLIEASPAYDPERDAFRDFPERVLELAD